MAKSRLISVFVAGGPLALLWRVVVGVPVDRVVSAAAAVQNPDFADGHATVRRGERGRRSLPLLHIPADDLEHLQRSSLLLLEDGKPLGPAHAPHEAIRSFGGGRYSYWPDLLIFSTE